MQLVWIFTNDQLTCLPITSAPLLYCVQSELITLLTLYTLPNPALLDNNSPPRFYLSKCLEVISQCGCRFQFEPTFCTTFKPSRRATKYEKSIRGITSATNTDEFCKFQSLSKAERFLTNKAQHCNTMPLLTY